MYVGYVLGCAVLKLAFVFVDICSLLLRLSCASYCVLALYALRLTAWVEQVCSTGERALCFIGHKRPASTIVLACIYALAIATYSTHWNMPYVCIHVLLLTLRLALGQRSKNLINTSDTN